MPEKKTQKAVIAEESIDPLDEEIFDYADNDIVPVNLPEQAKIVMDLFEGKIVE